MPRTTTVVIGAGHAGLAMSRCLTARSIDHVVLERGEVANSWKTERWDSLRLLTPNWQSRLPGYPRTGRDPDGFRTMPETVGFIERYAAAVSAPVRTHTRVPSVRRAGDGYQVVDRPGGVAVPGGGGGDRGVQRCPASPPWPRRFRRRSATLTPSDYRNPSDRSSRRRARGRCLGQRTQIAEEIHGRGGRSAIVGGRARPGAPNLPGPRHPVVDGPAGVLDER